jgi:monofunctional biosynthetic peptidoglycan transglycosylase
MTSVLRFVRGAIWAIVILVLAYVGMIVVLGLAYAGAAPVSTLMLGRWLSGRSVTRAAVPLELVSPALPIAVIASEDNRFCRHRGVDWGALREVVENADEDGPSRGASTVPMQTAKNLFLWPGRSFLRKALLATALPNPILRNPGRPSPRHRALANRLLGRMELAASLSGCVAVRRTVPSSD